MAESNTSVLGVDVNARNVMLAIGGGAAAVALGPALLALPVIAEVGAMTGLAIGPGGLAAIGGFLAAKNLGDTTDATVANPPALQSYPQVPPK